jgi:hypothetical protein
VTVSKARDIFDNMIESGKEIKVSSVIESGQRCIGTALSNLSSCKPLFPIALAIVCLAPSLTRSMARNRE